jgi:crotonobetainyl-CoA:carnitine CoA-transferase CaiB-like acyl-CoA transferase
MYSPVVNNYTAGDGRPFWIVGLEGDRHWPALARAVGHPEWLTDERFATLTSRAINARELIGLLDEIFASRPLAEWAVAFEAEPELFWSPVNTIEDVIADEQFLAAKSVVDVPDEQSSMPMLATPADFDGEPPRPRFRAPHVGEHTREILADLQVPANEIEALVESGVAIDGTTGGG